MVHVVPVDYLIVIICMRLYSIVGDMDGMFKTIRTGEFPKLKYDCYKYLFCWVSEAKDHLAARDLKSCSPLLPKRDMHLLQLRSGF